MKPYFEKMAEFGQELKKGQIKRGEENLKELQEIEADTLVLSYWRKADPRLYDELKGKVKEIHRIGDALAPRRLINAFYDGYKVASEL